VLSPTNDVIVLGTENTDERGKIFYCFRKQGLFLFGPASPVFCRSFCLENTLKYKNLPGKKLQPTPGFTLKGKWSFCRVARPHETQPQVK
jgi:hypothetical protein